MWGWGGGGGNAEKERSYEKPFLIVVESVVREPAPQNFLRS